MEDMVQAATAAVEAECDHPIAKGDPEIMARLREALSYRRKLPAFSRGQIYYDFDLGKARIAAA